jgi:hypothetical protein
MNSRASVPASPQPAAADRAQLLHGLTARDLERVALALEAELAASTRSVYASAWGQWEAWCRRRGLEALLADPEAICAYLAERAEARLGDGPECGIRPRPHAPPRDVDVQRPCGEDRTLVSAVR